MSNENEKKGLFGRIIGTKKAPKSSCCCNFELEEVPEEESGNPDRKNPEEKKGNSCCK